MTRVPPSPLRRTTARVVPVNRDGQVLLLYGRDPRRPEAPYWFTIGGAAEEGETLTAAGVRELHEETGIQVRPEELVGPYHRGLHEFTWNDDVTVSFEGLEALEVGNVLDSGWFVPDALPDALANPDLRLVARLAVEAAGL